jgi:threonine synthase
VSLGEGGTPIIPIAPNLYAKADYYMPTLSFKDRGAAVLMAGAKKLRVKRAAEDSSGNAGAAIAAYGARCGIGCDIFIPESTSPKKVKQLEMYGAVVHKIPGSRENTASATIQAVDDEKLFYASHVYNPLFYEGTKTYVYEIFEEMGHLPDIFIIPVGNGTLLLGCTLAFRELAQWGVIDRIPRILAVQAENCSPLEQAFRRGEEKVKPCEDKGTLAEGIAIANPPRGEQILQSVKYTGGDIIAVNEREISDARVDLARKGIYVEITSAANYAGYLHYMSKHPETSGYEVILPLCGAGLKSE